MHLLQKVLASRAGHTWGTWHRGKAVPNGHERNIAVQVNRLMAPPAILDVEGVTARTNCRAASGG
jgi:hypothetical protein